MGGLRGLCCSKGDKGDNAQDAPVRPAQPRPERATQNTPASVKRETSLADSTSRKSSPGVPVQEKPIQQTLAKRDLWKEAFDSLDPSQQAYVAVSGVSTTAAIDQVIKDTTAKYEQWQKGGLKIRRKDGNDINIRDCAERILGAAMKASEVISTAVSFDPTGQASSAWTVISFGMSIVQNRLDRRDAIFAASEFLAETLSYYALIDINYRSQNVGSDHNLDQALLRVYSAILEFTVEVKKGRDENEAKRTLQSVLALTDQPLQTLKDAVNSQSAIADKWATLAANLGDRKRAAEHLSKTDALLADMKNLASKALTAEEEAQLVWISDAPYSDRQRALQKKRTSDTGLWLLDSPEYNDWKTAPGSLLWLPGISGCGKSVLCSTIIQDIQEDCSLDPSKLLGYWYFQFSVDATKSTDTLARSLIRQLSRSPLLPAVTKIWEDHHLRGSQPGSNAVFAVLYDLLSNVTGDVYLVFDALDECPDDEECKERGPVLDLLDGLLGRQSKQVRIHILVTSRPEQDIKERLVRFSKIDLEAHLAEDVETFVTSCLTKRPLNRWEAEIHHLIYAELLNSQERRFRWAELQIMALEKCRNEDQIKLALKTIPQSLEETYRKVLDNIGLNDEALARQILIIICLSPVILHAQTVANMVGLKFPEDLVDICTTSFISLFDEKVQLAHFSVQEFLIVPEEGGENHPCQFSATNGHKYLTEKTVDILLEQTEVLTQKSAKSNTFLYAATHWDIHMTAAGGIDQLSPELQAKISRLFTETIVYLNWVRAAGSNDQKMDNEWSKRLEECQPPIHRASMMGLVHAVDCLLAQGADPLQTHSVTLSYSLGCDSFVVAANSGHFGVLQALLDKAPPLGQAVAGMILVHIGHSKPGEPGLAVILQKLWDLGLLRKKSSDVANEIDEMLVCHSMMNWQSVALDIMEIFLDWQPRVSVPMSDRIFLTAVCKSTDVLDLLLERCEFHISSTFLEGLNSPEFSSGDNRTSGLALLAIKRPDEFPVDNNLSEKFAGDLSLEEMKSLMQVRKSDICVTAKVLELAALNTGLFAMLWPDREPGTVITELMLRNAVTNESHSREILTFMQEHMDPQMNSNEETIHELVSTATDGVATLELLLGLPSSSFSVSERLIEIISAHKEATEMLSLLVNRGFEVPITEGIVSSAASNQTQGPAVIQYLLNLHPKPLPVTESAAVAAVQNSEHGAEVLEILLQDASSSLLTDKVFEEACQNKAAMVALLNRRQNSLPIESMLLRIADDHLFGWDSAHFSRDILQVLLERNLVNVDETVVETLAANFYALDALLSWKPDSPITEKALIVGAKDDRSMRVMLEAGGSGLHVSEDVLLAAAQTYNAMKVIKVIEHRCGPIDVTENLLRKAIREGPVSLNIGLLQRAPESLVAPFLSPSIWQDANLWNYKSRCIFLMGFFKKTVSSISESRSLDLPFDPEKERHSQLKELILYREAELSELPPVELAAEVLAELCYNETIEKYCEGNQFEVTDRLIEAAERNRIADKEKLKSFLVQKR
ncbi:hypothetical protein N7499_004276 [Penicillium canescens]|nr:hypothetical protein N7499_004276 [Penicillium canescens]KAJ6181403.1 hypothetical protein N7485_000045 [Penicillium canescens]